jgi:hypothetical protein
MTMTHRTSFSVENFPDGDACYRHYQPDGGRISVLDRMTGFGWRDVETGYRCPSGQWFLASGGYDIRDHLHELGSDEEMTQWVIDRANTCTGGHYPGMRSGLTLDQLVARDNWKPKAKEVVLSSSEGLFDVEIADEGLGELVIILAYKVVNEEKDDD